MIFNSPSVNPRVQGAMLDLLPILAGVLVLFVPTMYDLFHGAWSTDDQAHGPIILGLALWLLWRRRGEMLEAATPGGSVAGWAVFAFGCLLYIAGRSQQVLAFELGSFIVILAGLVMVRLGGRALAVVWFPFVFMMFMVPLPSAVVAALTMPMKMAVSYVTEHLLYWAGLPIARAGVVLQIGQYQLLVADACAGLQTLLTLEALGLFYLNVVKHTSPFRNVVLALLIIPISFTANVIRVIALTLITFYFGDAAGQGFLHGFAGMVLFVSALCLILAVDSLLQMMVRRREARQISTKDA